jgi:arsenate reductase (thioredoxin)
VVLQFVRDEPISVLFPCTANAARSQIAEARLRRRGRDAFRVASAGTSPADRIHSEALEALAEIGIDWSARRPKGFDAVQSQQWDLVFTLCDRSKEACAAIPGRPVYAHWGVPDPMDAHPSRRLDACRHTVNLLAWRIDLMLALPMESLTQLALEERLRTIGLAQPGAAPLGASE